MIFAASEELADAWEAACRARTKGNTFSHSSRFEGEHRFSFEPR
jgi:hypothetical protein